MAFSDQITDRQLALLSDLSALEEAGMIEAGGNDLPIITVDDDNQVIESPGTVTARGQELLARLRRSGKTIFP